MIVMEVSKKDVLLCNTAPIVEIISNFRKDPLNGARNQIHIFILGYDEDSRELYNIPEVRKFYQSLYNQIPEIFYWIDINSDVFILLGFMLYQPVKSNGGVTLSSWDLQNYLNEGFKGLNNFCKANGISSEPTDRLIKAKLDSLF